MVKWYSWKSESVFAELLYSGVGKATKLIPINTDCQKCLQAEPNLRLLLTTILVKGCVPVSAISSPSADGGLSLSLCEALTQLLFWAMPLEAWWGETSHEACSEESTAHLLQWWRSTWSSFWFLVAGEQLLSGVWCQTECLTSFAPRAQDRELMVKS